MIKTKGSEDSGGVTRLVPAVELLMGIVA